MYDDSSRTAWSSTAAGAFLSDVGVKDGKIVAVGLKLEGDSLQTVDAEGLVVSPGFIDPHTHFDVQLLWDGRGKTGFGTRNNVNHSRKLLPLPSAAQGPRPTSPGWHVSAN